MWLLLIIFLDPQLTNVQKLDDFATWKECQIERNRIGFEMAEAYPYTADFRIECQCPSCLKLVV
jgi:hypothetical protein